MQPMGILPLIECEALQDAQSYDEDENESDHMMQVAVLDSMVKKQATDKLK